MLHLYLLLVGYLWHQMRAQYSSRILKSYCVSILYQINVETLPIPCTNKTTQSFTRSARRTPRIQAPHRCSSFKLPRHIYQNYVETYSTSNCVVSSGADARRKFWSWLFQATKRHTQKLSTGTVPMSKMV
jgi:hypothetical protein